MGIVIRPSVDANGPVVLDLWKALEILRLANIQTEGGASFGQDTHAYGEVILLHDKDNAKAVALLEKAGIPAAES